ncbi:methyltransferase [Actinomycetaceae bacterium L2_0104]
MNETEMTEEIRQLRSALRQAQKDMAVLGKRNEELEKENRRINRTVNGAWEQLETLRHSTSWRVTAPIRLIKGTIRGVIR